MSCILCGSTSCCGDAAEAALAEKDKEIASLKKRFEEIKVVLSRGRDATGCSDEYFRGMYNGIEWCLCCIEEREANYKDVCEKSEEVQVLAKWEARDATKHIVEPSPLTPEELAEYERECREEARDE